MNHIKHTIQSVAIFGGAEVKEGSPLYQEAYLLGQKLAEKGLVVVNGGGPGIMEATTRGAKSVGGEVLTISLEPRSSSNFENHNLRTQSNTNINFNSYFDRMYSLIENSDCFVIFRGGSGTISEFAMTWCLARLYFGIHKPLILFGDFWKEIIDVLSKTMSIREQEYKVLTYVNSVPQTLEAIEVFKKEFAQTQHPPLDPEEAAFVR